MDFAVFQILLVLIAYLLGSVNSAIIVCRIMNLPDPRDSGSLNPGATNVLRIGNKIAAAITLLGDLLKAFIPVIVTNYFIGYGPTIVIVSLAALLGHMYPIYYRFQGGKGVATTLGILLGISWLLGLIWIIIWLSAALLFKYSSLAALLATSLILIFSWFWSFDLWIFAALSIITVLVFWRHRSNIRNLYIGDETKLGKIKKDLNLF